MIHNESVNVWSHLLGAIFFICLIGYTFFYYAPPHLGSHHRADWFTDGSLARQRDSSNLMTAIQKDIAFNSSNNQSTNATEQGGSSSFDKQVLSDAFKQPDFKKDHHATLFESIEHYLQHAIDVVSDPQVYVGCVDSLERFVKLVKSLPEHLDEQLTTTISNVKDIDLHNHKMDYLHKMIHYVDNRVDSWTSELQELANSPGFDFLELKPLFTEPQRLVAYVTRFPLFIHMICAIICLGSSAFFHLFKDHSEVACKTLARVDYAGISIMIAGSNTPPIFYSFFCQEMHEWRTIYLGLMYFFCFSSFVIFLVPKFDRPRFRVLRGSVFVICGLTSGIPIFHLEYLTDPKYLHDFHSFPWGLGGALYIFGAVMYMLKVPERFKPGRFDIVGSSHQFFHFLIVAAALVHYRASIQVFHDRQLFQCPNPVLEAFSQQINNS